MSALLWVSCVVTASLLVVPGHKILTQFDQQAHVPLENDPITNQIRVNVTGLMELLRATHANSFSFLLWSTNGREYLDLVRVLSLTANQRVDGVQFTMWVTLIPPSEAPHRLKCSIPADSPLTPFNESLLFNASLGAYGCLDYAAWAQVLGRLGQIWPHLYAVNIDDFSSNGGTFTQELLVRMRTGLSGHVKLIPTFYYGRTKFVLAAAPYLGNLTDGILFYFRNERVGQAQCRENISSVGAPNACNAPTNCTMPCLSGTCAERSVQNVPAEIADFVAALPLGHPIHIGVYFTSYHGCDAPSANYSREVISAALALPAVTGATVYITQRPARVAPGYCGPHSDDKGCVVREVFGAWGETPAARRYDPACPAAKPFLVANKETGLARTEVCCNTVVGTKCDVPEDACCLSPGDSGCPPGLPACFCLPDQPYEYGQTAAGGKFCCASQAGFPYHCSVGGECCLVPGLKDGCQGRDLCRFPEAKTLLTVRGAASETVATRVLLHGPGAVCLDGSPAGYYISPATDPAASRSFYIHHQGGGWCQNMTECIARAQTRLGSSTSWPSEMVLPDHETHVLMNRNRTINPLTASWNHVWVPYCDGGSFSGNRSAVDLSGHVLHFRGLAIREAVVAALRRTTRFSQASDLVIGGCSAGATAVYLHLDWYAAQVPTSARVRGVPDSGWFVDGDYTRDRKPHYSARMENLFQMMDARASLSKECVAAHGFRCLMAPQAAAYIHSPLFALNSRYDGCVATDT